MLFMPGDKYEAVSTDNGYNKFMLLKIRSVKHSDFGSYKCVAKNSLGETDGVIKLDGKFSLTLCLLAAHCIQGTRTEKQFSCLLFDIQIV
jgi:hypothetical protein